MAKVDDTPLELSFKIERESKNKKRYQEQGDPDHLAIDKLYVTKSQLKKWGDPEELEMVLRPRRQA